MTPTTPRESRKASSSSPITTIFFGGLSASGNSSDSKTGSQKRRSSSPMPVPGPLSVRNLLSSARSMDVLRGCCFAFGEAWRRVNEASTRQPQKSQLLFPHDNLISLKLKDNLSRPRRGRRLWPIGFRALHELLGLPG